MTALMATFVNIKTMADGTPRIVLDLQCTLSEIAEMGLTPGAAFGLARLTKEAAHPVAQSTPEPKEKPGQLCVMACTFCADPLFWKWLDVNDEITAKELLLNACGIESRKILDIDADAAQAFHEKIRKPFLTWKIRP